MATPAVLVLFNEPVLAKDHPAAESEHSVVEIAARIASVLGEGGFDVAQLALGSDPTLLWAKLQKRRPDAVFNLFEGNPHHPETESFVAGLLEWAGIPYTGSPFATLTLARAKHTAKYLLRGAGLPTADFMVVDKLPMPACQLRFPVIVKPATQDASVGVDQGSVCESASAVEERVRFLLKEFGPPVMVEEYIAGRELHVALVELPELQTLPATQIVFPAGGAWSILTYEAKWAADAPRSQVAALPKAMSVELSDIAMKAYRLLGCRDYARVDFRVNEAGRPFILEVNPNPEISEEAGFADCLGRIQFSHRDFIVRLAQQAVSRSDPSRQGAKARSRT